MWSFLVCICYSDVESSEHTDDVVKLHYPYLIIFLRQQCSIYLLHVNAVTHAVCERLIKMKNSITILLHNFKC